MQQRRCGKWRTRRCQPCARPPTGEAPDGALAAHYGVCAPARCVTRLDASTPRRPTLQQQPHAKSASACQCLPCEPCSDDCQRLSAASSLLMRVHRVRCSPLHPRPSQHRAPLAPSRPPPHRKLHPQWPLRRASTASCPSQS